MLESSASEGVEIYYLVAYPTGPGHSSEAQAPRWSPSLGDSSWDVQAGRLAGLDFLSVCPRAIPSAIPWLARSRDGAQKAREQFCILLPLVLSGVISLITLLYFGVTGALCILLISYRDLYSSS